MAYWAIIHRYSDGGHFACALGNVTRALITALWFLVMAACGGQQAVAQQPAPPPPPDQTPVEGGNPFVGTLGPQQDFFFQLINRFEGLQAQIQQVNNRVLTLQRGVNDTRAQLQRLDRDDGAKTGSPILDQLAELEEQEQLSSQVRRALRNATFILCVNERALFQSADGARFLVPAVNASENENYRLVGGCG